MPGDPLPHIRVFLAEDNRADVYLVELALREHNLSFDLRVAKDGEEALWAVNAFGKGEPVPDIAMLDINLPREQGNKVMQSIRENSCCAATPIIIMSSAQTLTDQAFAKQFQAVFFQKSTSLTEFLQLGQLVKDLLQRQLLSVSAFTPGSSTPARNSSEAPPPVET